MAFIKTLLIIVIVYYVLKLAFKYILRKFISKYSMNGQQPEYKKKKQKEGTVNIEYTSKNKEHHFKDEGEYIDYEEIK